MDLTHLLISWLPHPHWWRYFRDKLGASRECRLCQRTEFVALGREGLREKVPLTGIGLWRWKAALRVYRFGCKVSGRHPQLLERNEAWKQWHCPHCGWTLDD